MKAIRKSGHAIRPFLEGLVMIFDLGGLLHPQRRALGDFSEDVAATRSDWTSVGGDIRSVIGQYQDQGPERMTEPHKTHDQRQ